MKSDSSGVLQIKQRLVFQSLLFVFFYYWAFTATFLYCWDGYSVSASKKI